MGADLSAHGRSAGETLLKLAKIYHISASGQPFDQSVRDEITQIAKQGVATDPVAFKDLDVLLQPPSAPEQAKAWADAIGAGLQGGAALGSLMDPGASAALGVFAAIAAPGLKYLATPGLNLSERPFPPGNATPISEIAALALDKMMGVLDQNPSLAAHVDSIKADLGVDLSVSARSDELNRLPSDIRSAVATNTQMTPDQIKKAVATAVGGSLNGFVANAPQVPAAPPQPGAPPPPSPSSAEIKAQVQAAQTDVQGAITVGTFIIGRVSGGLRWRQKLRDCHIRRSHGGCGLRPVPSINEHASVRRVDCWCRQHNYWAVRRGWWGSAGQSANPRISPNK